MLYLSRDTIRVLLYCVEHEKSGALTGLECDLVQLLLGILLASGVARIFQRWGTEVASEASSKKILLINIHEMHVF